jgi:hypothetical protein
VIGRFCWPRRASQTGFRPSPQSVDKICSRSQKGILTGHLLGFRRLSHQLVVSSSEWPPIDPTPTARKDRDETICRRDASPNRPGFRQRPHFRRYALAPRAADFSCALSVSMPTSRTCGSPQKTIARLFTRSLCALHDPAGAAKLLCHLSPVCLSHDRQCRRCTIRQTTAHVRSAFCLCAAGESRTAILREQLDIAVVGSQPPDDPRIR